MKHKIKPKEKNTWRSPTAGFVGFSGRPLGSWSQEVPIMFRKSCMAIGNGDWCFIKMINNSFPIHKLWISSPRLVPNLIHTTFRHRHWQRGLQEAGLLVQVVQLGQGEEWQENWQDSTHHLPLYPCDYAYLHLIQWIVVVSNSTLQSGISNLDFFGCYLWMIDSRKNKLTWWDWRREALYLCERKRKWRLRRRSFPTRPRPISAHTQDSWSTFLDPPF